MYNLLVFINCLIELIINIATFKNYITFRWIWLLKILYRNMIGLQLKANKKFFCVCRYYIKTPTFIHISRCLNFWSVIFIAWNNNWNLKKERSCYLCRVRCEIFSRQIVLWYRNWMYVVLFVFLIKNTYK